MKRKGNAAPGCFETLRGRRLGRRQLFMKPKTTPPIPCELRSRRCRRQGTAARKRNPVSWIGGGGGGGGAPASRRRRPPRPRRRREERWPRSCRTGLGQRRRGLGAGRRLGAEDRALRSGPRQAPRLRVFKKNNGRLFSRGAAAAEALAVRPGPARFSSSLYDLKTVRPGSELASEEVFEAQKRVPPAPSQPWARRAGSLATRCATSPTEAQRHRRPPRWRQRRPNWIRTSRPRRKAAPLSSTSWLRAEPAQMSRHPHREDGPPRPAAPLRRTLAKASQRPPSRRLDPPLSSREAGPRSAATRARSRSRSAPLRRSRPPRRRNHAQSLRPPPPDLSRRFAARAAFENESPRSAAPLLGNVSPSLETSAFTGGGGKAAAER